MAAELTARNLEIASAEVHTPESFGRALVAQLAQQAAKELGESKSHTHEIELNAKVRLLPGEREGMWCVWACICGLEWCVCVIVCGGGAGRLQ